MRCSTTCWSAGSSASAGRKEAPGRPFLYETTREFLVAFGLRDLGDLPKVDGELVIPDLGAAEAVVGGREPWRS